MILPAKYALIVLAHQRDKAYKTKLRTVDVLVRRVGCWHIVCVHSEGAFELWKPMI